MPAATIRAAEAPLPATADRLHRFSVEECHSMIESGILADDRKVELLEGLVVEKMGQNPPPSSALRKLLRLLNRLLPGEYVASPQLPITLATSEPEPDIAIVIGPDERYDERHPIPGEIALVIEIADESLARDRRDKAKLYAGSKIPEYWIVNLTEAAVEVYSKPIAGREPRYKSIQSYARLEPVPLSLAGKTIAKISFREILT
jgi:Uma2 family endonuclease